ncbi:MAG: hypothetical protein Q8M66_05925 [Actinomycetota bacterium]|nr:hypothetical protein [Actinomycetota bacterium]
MFIPDYLKNTEPGVYVRREPVSNESIYMIEIYRSAMLKILQSDKPHYERLLLEALEKMPSLIGAYKKAASPGGGHPKFESAIMGVDHVTVYDMITDFYKETQPDFLSLFPQVEIEYQKMSLGNPFKIKNADVVCFIHFLEHCQSWDKVVDWINLQNKDIVLYGPNIEAAQNMDWHHFHGHNVDHNVFFTIEAIERVATAAGYTCQSFAYSDDMLVWMRC